MGSLARASHPPSTTAACIPPRRAGAWARPWPPRALMRLDPEPARSAVAHRVAGRGRAARRVRLGRQVAPGRAGVGGGSARRAAGRGRGPGAAGGGRARVRARPPGARYAEPDRRRARDRGELDQGLALLPPDPRVDRGGAGACGRGRPAVAVVHPVSLQAARGGTEPSDGLEAKFSIPYLIAYTLEHGEPTLASFASVDGAAVTRARGIEVRADRGLRESEAVLLDADGAELARVGAARGSPGRPLDERGAGGEGALAGRRCPGRRARRPRAPGVRAAGAGRAAVAASVGSTIASPYLAHG